MDDHDLQRKMDEFFRSNPSSDAQYLKEYVKTHPGNKMAWYFLGREYDATGNPAKAQYCYRQAGDVYAAFEQKSIQTRESLPASSAFLRRLSSVFRYILAVLIFAVLFLSIPGSEVDNVKAPVVIDSSTARHPAKPVAVPSKPKDNKLPGDLNKSLPVEKVSIMNGIRVFYTVDHAPPSLTSALFNEMITPVRGLPEYSLLVQLIHNNKKPWISWSDHPAPLMALQKKEENGQVQVHYYNPTLCDCFPSDSTAASKVAGLWSHQQLEQMVLYSAISAYRSVHGQNPKTIDALSQNYPNNILPGHTGTMSKAFAGLTLNPTKAVHSKSTPPAPPSGQQSAPAPPPSGQQSASAPPPGQTSQQAAPAPLFQLDPSLRHPLQIIVDKKNHRLALVDGPVMIRNYPIGLGGKRTPTGNFEITEKVKDPNGKSNGVFGSRGMTLSHTLYAIHGTNDPGSIGKDRSLGCIHMEKKDLQELFDMVPLHTKVKITNGVLPKQIKRGASYFHLPSQAKETNPGHVYHWLG